MLHPMQYYYMMEGNCIASPPRIYGLDGSYIHELCSHGRQIGVESARTAEIMVLVVE